MIAIHVSENSFSDYWIPYCEANKIPYKKVNCYDSNIIEHIRDCNALMWHHHHGDYRDLLFAKELLFSAAAMGKVVFPDFSSNWHFDDKVGQKYLLEAINAPLVSSYVYYSRDDALKWLETTIFPIVFKLRGGAGSSNVKLLKSRKDARRLINKAFRKGFSSYGRWAAIVDRLNKLQDGNASWKNVLGSIYRSIIPRTFDRLSTREKGYFYVQEFIAGNDGDIRVVVVDGKAFCLKRLNRKNDFRASGSGTILYDKDLFSEETIAIAFDVAKKLNTSCCAFDFVYKENRPLIVEISYGFSAAAYEACQGYWDEQLIHHDKEVLPCDWMVDYVIKEVKKQKTAR